MGGWQIYGQALSRLMVVRRHGIALKYRETRMTRREKNVDQGGGQIFSLASSSFRSLWRNRSMIRAGSGRGMGIKEPSGSRSPSATGNEDAAYKARLTLDVPPPTDAAKRSLQNKFLTNHW